MLLLKNINVKKKETEKTKPETSEGRSSGNVLCMVRIHEDS